MGWERAGPVNMPVMARTKPGRNSRRKEGIMGFENLLTRRGGGPYQYCHTLLATCDPDKYAKSRGAKLGAAASQPLPGRFHFYPLRPIPPSCLFGMR